MQKGMLISLFMLAACQQRPPVGEPVIADIPVLVSCHARAVTEPDWNVPHVAKGAGASEKLKAVLADLELSKGYAEELKAELEGCS